MLSKPNRKRAIEDRLNQAAGSIDNDNMFPLNTLVPDPKNVRDEYLSMETLVDLLKVDTSETLVDRSGETLLMPESLDDIPHINAFEFGDYEKAAREYGELVGLAKSIHMADQDDIPPIIIRERPDGRYQINSGHRRRKAYRILSTPKVKCSLHGSTSDSPEQTLKNLIGQANENLAQASLTLTEKLRVIERTIEALANVKGVPPSKVKKKDVSGYLAFDKHTFNVIWPLLTAPDDVRDAIQAGQITSARKAYDIARIADPDARRAAITNDGPVPAEPKKKAKRPTPSSGVAPSSDTGVSLGRASKTSTVRTLVLSLVADEAPLAEFRDAITGGTDLDDELGVKEAWDKLIKLADDYL